MPRKAHRHHEQQGMDEGSRSVVPSIPLDPTFASMKTLRTLMACGIALQAIVSFGQWEPYGSGLNSVRSITTAGSAIYLASYPAGVFKSDNDGLTWTPSSNGITNTSGNTFTRSVGRNANHLFAGTHSGIYRSNDGGANWTLANGSLTASSTVYANKFFQFGNTTFAVFSGTIANGGGIHRTVTNGDSWLIGHSGMGSNATVYHLATSGTALYAATSVGLYKSTDNGQQWTAVPGSNFATDAVQVVPGRLVIISNFGYRYSTNDGLNWTNAIGAVANPTKGELIAYDGKLFAITGTNSGVLVSIDNGNSYTAFNAGLTPIDAVSQEQFHATGTKLYLGTFSDIYSIPGSTVSLDNNFGTAGLTVSPSLFNEGFDVDFERSAGTHGLLLIDASGRIIEQWTDLGMGRIHLARGNWAAGRYTLVLLKNGQRVAHKGVVAQ
jgi:hypothetical protein